MSAKNITPKRTIYHIMQNFKGRGLIAVKKASGNQSVQQAQGWLPCEYSAKESCQHQCSVCSTIAAGWCEAQTLGQWACVLQGQPRNHFSPSKTFGADWNSAGNTKKLTAQLWYKVKMKPNAVPNVWEIWKMDCPQRKRWTLPWALNCANILRLTMFGFSFHLGLRMHLQFYPKTLQWI